MQNDIKPDKISKIDTIIQQNEEIINLLKEIAKMHSTSGVILGGIMGIARLSTPAENMEKAKEIFEISLR